MQKLILAFSRILPPSLRSWLRQRQLTTHLLGKLRDKPQVLQGPLAGCVMRGSEVGAYLSGEYESATAALIEWIVRPGMVCVDCGAHMGYFTLLMARLVGPSGRVYAFEAYPVNADLVRDNVRLNGFEGRANVENVCVTDGSKAFEALYPGRASSAAEWNIMGHDVDGHNTAAEIIVPAKALDACFSSECAVDFVKMDIEGAEGKALAGMRLILKNQRPALFIEFHDDEAWGGRRELLDAGYSLYDTTTPDIHLVGADSPRVYHCLALPDATPVSQL